MSPSEANERITHFFGVFRHRVNAIEEIHKTYDRRMLPERFILVSAALDALAMYWGNLYRPSVKSGSERMGEFLIEHGNRAIYERVAAPLLVQRGREEKAPFRDKSVREWKDDPRFDDLTRDASLSAAGVDAKWIRWARYGEILYREIRCSWVHESGEPRDLPPAEYKVFDGMDYPHYTNSSRFVPTGRQADPYAEDDRKLIMFPFAFLVETLRHAIDSFERACLADRRLPERA